MIALNMALNGTPREETDRYLSENFQLSDRDGLLDEVYASVEAERRRRRAPPRSVRRSAAPVRRRCSSRAAPAVEVLLDGIEVGCGAEQGQPLRTRLSANTISTQTGQNWPWAPEAGQMIVQTTNRPAEPPVSWMIRRVSC